MTSVRVKTIKHKINDEGLNTMFMEMLDGDGTLDIIIPKYTILKTHLTDLHRDLSNFVSGPFCQYYAMKKELYKLWNLDFTNFSNELKELIANAPIELKDAKEYKSYKENKIFRKIIVTGGDLSELCKSEDPSKYIETTPGDSYIPISWTKFDLKSIWLYETTTPSLKKYIVKMIMNIQKRCKEIYKIISSPDNDIKKFSGNIVNVIGQLAKTPELNRCNMAITAMENSTKMLDEKFGEYYKDAKQAGSSSIIMENYASDIIKQNGKSNPLLAMQLRKVVAYLKKHTVQSSDTKIKEVMDRLDEQ
jgi:hypothetical protein